MSKRKTSFKVLVLIVVVALVAAMSLGCTTPAAPAPDTTAPAPDTTAPDTTATPPAPPADQIVLRVAYHEPTGSAFDLAWHQFDQELQDKTGGAAKLELYPDEQLGKGADAVSMVVNGVTDIGWIVAAFFPGQFPISEVINLPMVGVPNAQTGAKSLWDMYEQTPEMQAEWAQGMHLICFCNSSYQFVNTKSKKVETIADMKGLKLRVAGAFPSQFITAIGGSPVSMAPPDMYEAMDKGVLDGSVFDWNGIKSFKLADVLNYAMDLPIVSVPQAICINQATWDGLPDNVKQALNELGGADGSAFFGASLDSVNDSVSADFKALPGREIVSISDDERANWVAAAKPVWDGWVSNMNNAGLDGQALLDKFQSIVQSNTK